MGKDEAFSLMTDYQGLYVRDGTPLTAPPKPAPDAMREALEALIEPYKSLTEEALRAGVLMEFGPPKPERGLAILAARAILSAPVPPADGARATLETARQEIVLAIAFLGRDTGTERMIRTVEEVLTRLARADTAIRSFLSPSPAVAAEPDPLIGLDERLDRLLLAAIDGNNFVLSTDSAKNIVGIVREWIRVKSATPPVRGDLEAIARIIDPNAFRGAYLSTIRTPSKDKAFAKADAILSLPVQHGASEQEALQDIARQKTISEMIEDGNEIGDLEYAYNTMIARARNALSRQAPHSSSEAK